MVFFYRGSFRVELRARISTHPTAATPRGGGKEQEQEQEQDDESG
jgi:hypothetical protein